MMAHVVVDNDWPQYGIEIPRPRTVSSSDSSLDGLKEEKAKLENISLQSKSGSSAHHRSIDVNASASNGRLNKFVRRLHEMLSMERDGGIVEWRRGLLILHSIDRFSKEVLPKYFNTRNFKTFRRQLNYYGFLHVRSFSTSGSTTTALWVNQELADHGSDCISSVLKLKRVEPTESAKTPEARRVRKTQASSSVEVEGLGSLIPGYLSESMYTSKSSSGVCPVPQLVHLQHFQHGEPTSPTISKKMVPCEVAVHVSPPNIHSASVSQDKNNDPLIGLAAELLLSLSNGAV